MVFVSPDTAGRAMRKLSLPMNPNLSIPSLSGPPMPDIIRE
jgi:hypothetical protein